MEILLFGGTTEGRLLAEWLDARDCCDVVVCTATDYGSRLVEGGRRVHCVQGPLAPEEKRALVDAHDFSCVVDATHPYAQHISQSIAELARDCGLDLLRIARDDCEVEGPWTSVADAAAAAAHLAETTGNVLLTTGTKDLGCYVRALPDFAERLFVRVLPLATSLARVEELGVPTAHVIALQGPCSEWLNRALIDEYDISHLVTKRSGLAGGFAEKAGAARACGIELVVIERPDAEAGVTLDQAKRLLEERYGC